MNVASYLPVQFTLKTAIYYKADVSKQYTSHTGFVKTISKCVSAY